MRYFNEKAETMSRDEITALQDSKVRNILAYAMANNDYFRNKMNAAGISGAADFNGLADLAKLPFMSKEDFRKE